ncbi:MAG: nucleotidyltransferase [Armatimonadia bacterium]|nr:nucleotidyltransferase [Armatimonadia bacterium]
MGLGGILVTTGRIRIGPSELDDFRRRHGIRRLSLFGSILRRDSHEASDVDVLVEFEEGRRPGFFGLMAMQEQLTAALGRQADLRTPEDLSRHFRAKVCREAEVLSGE